MNEHTLPGDLALLVAAEPDFSLTADAVAHAGRRARRRRRVFVPGAAVLGVGVLVAGSAVLASSLGSAPHRMSRVTSQPQIVVPHPAGGPRSQLVQQVVLDNSPAGWTYDFVQGVAPNDDGIDGTVDDGQGKSRTYVTVTHEPGNLTRQPCDDPEFVGGGTCTASALGDGRTLIQRSSAGGAGVRTVVAGVLYADGTGVYAESTNAWWPSMSEVVSGQRVTPEQKRAMAEPTITRAQPVYSLAELVRVVKAVDAAVFAS